LDNGIVYYLDPIILTLGPLQLRYYGLIFASMLYLGFLFWRWQLLRGGYSSDLADRYLIWGVISVLAGSRLGHCLFYQADYYLANPVEILYFWKGGLASHGATIGLMVGMLGFSIRYRMRFIEVLDRFSISATGGAALVRLGNFFNSEIVGRVTDSPLGVKFLRHDCHSMGLCQIFETDNPEAHARWAELVERTPARHPSQLYEFALGMFVMLSLYMIDRWAGREKRPLGLMAGSFLAIYFFGRFFVEYFKEYQIDQLKAETFTMGQYLSVLPFLVGVGIITWSLVARKSTDEGRPEPLDVTPRPEKTSKSKSKSKSKSRSKKSSK